MKKINIFWFRRDIRLYDNSGLHHALQSGLPVLPIFIFDTEILSKLENKSDRRVDYFHQALHDIDEKLLEHKSGIDFYVGTPLEVFEQLIKKYEINTVFWNNDYEPQAIKRDTTIAEFLKKNKINFQHYKDQVIFEKNEVVKKDGLPYTVYTPYSNKWKENLKNIEIINFKIDFSGFLPFSAKRIPSLDSLGFKKTGTQYIPPVLSDSIITTYDLYRDFPSMDHTTHLGVALRFGTISIRECVQYALLHNNTWLNELIWREFFMQILFHFPRVVHHCFKEKYENIEWRNDEKEFRLWCKGKTGYPIVDAGMRELNETGFMHNRVRMIVASFLTKHLLIDWRWGEAYFAEKLLDYDLSANNGNWQWAAGCGCDAAPYFRVFNPYEQTKKFDKDLKYIKKWLSKDDFTVLPVVEHAFARKRALEVYSKAVK
ncbi:cryptochrome/photolyase family protein [Chryseobacterium fistulae]|uniref:Deoxyribodipyrimidine photo-lyase n=1 Tax=Chryseobacterium fistulae TaxID=2675058 RepID=A0A6N4XL83_9FLAO|nr:deoxyribodipyrimidine photo-lyase [Chryseobacterium fistulae]CAA7386644.1 Deoxyribodipyrimidine photo-lyase [Chryseobacterium fistulae]